MHRHGSPELFLRAVSTLSETQNRVKAGRTEMENVKGYYHLLFAQELGVGRTRYQSGVHAPREKFAHCLASALAIAERPFVHIHSDKFVGQLRIHVARELHRVIDSRFTMLERKGYALANRLRHLNAHGRAQRATDSIATERRGKSFLFDHPMPRIAH